MKERDLDILGMCETRYVGEGSRRIHEDFVLFFKGSDEACRYGVALIMKPEVHKMMTEVIFWNERMIAVTLKMGREEYSIIQVYAPHSGRPQEEKMQFRENLQDVMDRTRGNNKIVMGDMNAHVGRRREGEERVLGVHGIGDRNLEGEHLVDFAMRNNLSIMNTFFEHRESMKWTWYRWSREGRRYEEKSMIDMFLTNNRKLIIDVKSIPSVSLDSDHRLVVCKLRWKRREKWRTRVRERFCVEKLKMEECRMEFDQKITFAAENGPEVYESIDEMWGDFRRKIEMIASEVLGKKRITNGKKKKTVWWNEEVREAIKVKNKRYREWMKDRTELKRNIYCRARNHAENIKRISKMMSWDKIGRDLREDMRGTKKLTYSTAKAMRKSKEPEGRVILDKAGEPLTEEEEIADRWREYFEELLNVEEDEIDVLDEEQEERNEGLEEEMEDITLEEIREATRRLKDGKSPGYDGLSNEIFKSGDGINTWLKKLFDRIWRDKKIPDEWRRAIICPIYKKGDRRKCENHRGITLLIGTSKIYERILERRLRQRVEGALGEWQHGFRPGRSTTDLIFYMKMLTEKIIEWNEKAYVAFIDLEKAFDRINRRRLWGVLREQIYRVPEELVRAIESLYEDPISMVRDGSEGERWFGVRTGVRQGSILSPILFTLFLDHCLRRIDEGRRGGKQMLVYADDAAVVTRSNEELREEVNRWKEVLEDMGMRMNLEKTEVMVIAREEEEVIIEIEGKRLKQVNDFKYLGVVLDSRGKQEKELNERIGKFSKNVGMLYPLLKERGVPREVKVTIYDTVLRPILLYGSECWTLNTVQKNKLEAAEMRVLRLIRGVTLRERMRSERIREDLGMISIIDKVERERLRWFGHVKRMEEGSKLREILDWKPEGRRPVGRPRKRWLEGVREAVERRGATLEYVEEQGLHLNRNAWRNFLRNGT